MADDDYDVQTGESGASDTFPAQCSSLRKNGYVMIKDRPCKIVEMSTSKTGKHGHAKVHLVGIDLFTGKKLEDICPSTHNMNVPHVKRCDYFFVDQADGFVTLMADDGSTRDDLKMPPESNIRDEIEAKFSKGEDFNVTVLSACGSESIVGTKTCTLNK